jgi:pimeloyl-ACP methyl ester carboxylesterase
MAMTMASHQPTLERATSADGTAIAFERRGSGAPLILIGGAFAERSASLPLAQALAPHLTAVTYDRRGRGDSGDTDAYSVEREIEDLDALIRAVGGRASLFGHSSGACLALEAAARGRPLEHVLAYEPPYIPDGSRRRPGADLAQRLRTLVAEGHRDDAVALFQTEGVGIPAEMVKGFRSTPMWAGLVGLAHTLPYDLEVTGPGSALPVSRLGAIAVPTVVMVGSASFDWMLPSGRDTAAAIPGARLLVLDGLDHGSPGGKPTALVPAILEFLRESQFTGEGSSSA